MRSKDLKNMVISGRTEMLLLYARYPTLFRMEVSKDILNEIADSLQSGFKCFVHRDTCEVVTYMDPDQFPEMDPKGWKEEIRKVKKNKRKFIEIERMDSSESFRIMEEFAHTLDSDSTKIRLLTALEGQKPFANFKLQIDNSGEYRELWFLFKQQKTIEWVRDQLNLEIH